MQSNKILVCLSGSDFFWTGQCILWLWLSPVQGVWGHKRQWEAPGQAESSDLQLWRSGTTADVDSGHLIDPVEIKEVMGQQL